MEKLDINILKLAFEIEEGNSFNCNDCIYKKYVACCPEEGDCRVKNDYLKWLEKKLVKICNENKLTVI